MRFLLYGSTGYVGRTVAEHALEQELEPVLAGRDERSVRELARGLGVEHRVFEISDRNRLYDAVTEVPAVLNCAGPFIHTHRPILEACLEAQTHYLDISGEPMVYQSMESYDAQAKERGVMVLPSVGFDVVATDCLAAHLKLRLPTATHLSLAFHQDGPAAAPPGTLKTLIEMLSYTSTRLHRIDGQVQRVPWPRKTVMIDFGDGPVKASMMTWGDIYMAYRSTGIPNIEDYIVFPPGMRTQVDLSEWLRPFFKLAPVRRWVGKSLRGGATKPEIEATVTRVWGEVSDAEGNRMVTEMTGPEAGLVWTYRAALTVVGKVLGGDTRPGLQTPATVYGPDLALEVEGVTRTDIE